MSAKPKHVFLFQLASHFDSVRIAIKARFGVSKWFHWLGFQIFIKSAQGTPANVVWLLTKNVVLAKLLSCFDLLSGR